MLLVSVLIVVKSSSFAGKGNYVVKSCGSKMGVVGGIRLPSRVVSCHPTLFVILTSLGTGTVRSTVLYSYVIQVCCREMISRLSSEASK